MLKYNLYFRNFILKTLIKEDINNNDKFRILLDEIY